MKDNIPSEVLSHVESIVPAGNQIWNLEHTLPGRFHINVLVKALHIPGSIGSLYIQSTEHTIMVYCPP